MLCLSQMLEIDKGVVLKPFVQRSQVCGTETKRIFADEVVKVPVDKLPIESIIVRNEQRSALAVLLEPIMKSLHDQFWFIKILTLLA